MINAEDVEKATEAEFLKILDILPQVGEITILQEGKPVAMFLSVELYEHCKEAEELIKALGESKESDDI